MRAVITLATSLPTIAVANVTLDGTTQTTTIGNTNTGTLGTTTTVGVDGLTVTPVNRPEVEISLPVGSNAVLTIGATSCTVKGIAIHGAGATSGTASGTNRDLGAGILINPSSNGFAITDCFVGSTALSYSYPTDGTYCGTYGISITSGAGGGTITHSLIGFTGNSGIYCINGGTSSVTISGCQFNQNGYNANGGDAITLGSSNAIVAGPMTISGNLITAPNSSGVQLEIGASSLTTIENNTMLSCGLGGGNTTSSLEGSAICYLQRNGTHTGSSSDVIRRNIIQSSEASGVVVGYGQKTVQITQNRISNNGSLSIDLIDNSLAYPGNTTTVDMYGNGDGVTGNRNNSGVVAASPNGGIDYPIFTSAQLNGTSLIVAGYVGTAANQTTFAGATVELYEAVDDGNNNGVILAGDGKSVAHGELGRYLGSLTVGSTGGFSGTLAVSNLAAGNTITGTAWLSTKGTSEASSLITVTPTNPPIATDLVNATLQNTADRTNLSVSLAATTTTVGGTITSFTIVSLPSVASGALYYNNGTNVVPATVGLSIPYANRANLSFDPAVGFSGDAIIGYTATDNANKTSDGNATVTIPVNSPPIANNITNAAIPNTNAQTSISALSGTDSDGTITSFTITSIPSAAAGKLYYNNGTTTVQVTGTISVPYARANQLLFTPTAGYNGQAIFQYTATDNNNGVSAVATYTIPVGTGITSSVNAVPTADSKTNTSIPVNAGTTSLVPVTGADTDGTIAGFTIKTLPSTGTLYFNGAVATVGTQVLANQANLLSFKPSSIGSTSFTYTATDNRGAESTVATFTIPVVGPLPVTLSSFVVQAAGLGATIRWTTATELDNAYFVVERSYDAVAFSPVSQVAGKGNTSTGYAYQATDPGVAQQPNYTVYYRLRQVDTDGTITYSPVRVLRFAENLVDAQLAPNPTSGTITLQLPVTGTQCLIYTTTGRLLQTQYTNDTTPVLDVSSLPAGLYMLQLQFDGGSMSTHRFIKQ